LVVELDSSQTYAAIERLNALLRKRAPYNLLFGNCETFARKVMGEPGVSWQIVTAAIFAFGAYKLMQS
jgi:hypothetical protein